MSGCGINFAAATQEQLGNAVMNGFYGEFPEATTFGDRLDFVQLLPHLIVAGNVGIERLVLDKDSAAVFALLDASGSEHAASIKTMYEALPENRRELLWKFAAFFFHLKNEIVKQGAQ